MIAILPPSEQRKLRDLSNRVPDRTVLEYPNIGVDSGRLPIKITAYDAGTGYYSWTEQSYNGSGVYVDAPNAIKGSPTVYPAVERNGFVLPAFPVYSQAWARTQDETVGMIWEFDAGAESIVPTLTVSKASGTTVTAVNAIVISPSGSPLQVSGTTGTATISIDAATASVPGYVTTVSQSFGGAKTFTAATTFNTNAGNFLYIDGRTLNFTDGVTTKVLSVSQAGGQNSQGFFSVAGTFSCLGLYLGQNPYFIDFSGAAGLKDGTGSFGTAGQYLINGGSSGSPVWTSVSVITSITGIGISAVVSSGVATVTLGNISPTTVNNLTISSPGGKTLTVSNTLTLAGTDGSTVNFGGGGTIQAVSYSGSASDLSAGTLATARLPAFSSSQITATAGTGSLSIVNGSVTNANLANSTITINGTAVSLGGSITTSAYGTDSYSPTLYGAL